MADNGNATPEGNGGENLGGLPAQAATPTYAPETIALMEKKQWKTDADIAKGYTELEKFVGKDPKSLLALPTDEKDEAGWDAVYNRLGRPETSDKYAFKNETGIELDADSLKSFNEMAHKERYTQKQYEAGLKAHLEVFKNLEAKANQAAEAEFKACDEALDKEWGQDRQKRTAEALEVAKKVGIYEALEELKLGSNPKAIKMLDTLRQMMTDDEIKSGSDKTKLSVQEEVKKLIDSESYINGLHPEHTKTMNRLKELYGVK